MSYNPQHHYGSRHDGPDGQLPDDYPTGGGDGGLQFMTAIWLFIALMIGLGLVSILL